MPENLPDSRELLIISSVLRRYAALGGRNVAPVSRWVKAADDYIRPRADKPNLKSAAAATARSAKRDIAQKAAAAR